MMDGSQALSVDNAVQVHTGGNSGRGGATPTTAKIVSRQLYSLRLGLF